MSDFYAVTVEPSEPVITLAECKVFLRVDEDLTSDDGLITALIDSATEYAERYTNRYFVERTVVGKFDCLELSRFEMYPFIQIRRSPFSSLTSLTLTTESGDEAITEYTIKEKQGFSRILFTGTLPTPDINTAYPVTATFKAGYGGRDDVPEQLRTAIKAHVMFMWRNRGDVIADGDLDAPLEAITIYKKYRILNTYA